jgi:Protein of unknown function (DUF4019)
MKLLGVAATIIVAIGATTAAAALTLELSADTANETNLTTDSSPGWRPTAEQRQRVLQTVEAFLGALETAHYADACGMLSEINQRAQTQAQFDQNAQKFQQQAGPLKFWRVLKVTWTKDPAHAPSPGIYVSVDLAAQFANVDRDCGYIILYQRPAGGDFTIMRRENNFLDNAMARDIESKHSKTEVANVWRQLSRYCPSYIPPPNTE